LQNQEGAALRTTCGGSSLRFEELLQINVTLPVALVRELRQRSECEEATISAIIESALVMFLDDLQY
jgi:hypothetical protein